MTSLVDDTITLTPAIDIFAFGMCALETAALEISSNSETGGNFLFGLLSFFELSF